MEWVNWSGSQRCTPARIATPRTRAELAQAIVDGPGPVRVRGAGHSFNGGTMTEGTLISLDALTRVLDADPATGRVRVEGGIRLHALSRELHARGLAMENLGDIDAQSVAGAISTGTHGTGLKLPDHLRPDRGGRAGPGRRHRDDHHRRRRAARRARLGRRARRRRRGHAALRAGVPDAQHRPPGAARGRPRRASSTARRRSTTSSSGRSRTRTSRSRARTRPPRIRRPSAAASAPTRATS